MRKRSSDNLSFKDFALALSVFAPDAPYEQKLKLAFDMFDFDGDKAIGRSDLEALLRALLPEGVDNLLFSPEKKGEDNSGLKLVPGIAERVRGRCVRALQWPRKPPSPHGTRPMAGAGGVGHRR